MWAVTDARSLTTTTGNLLGKERWPTISEVLLQRTISAPKYDLDWSIHTWILYDKVDYIVIANFAFFLICQSIPFLHMIFFRPVLNHLGNRNVYWYLEAVLYLNCISVELIPVCWYSKKIKKYLFFFKKVKGSCIVCILPTGTVLISSSSKGPSNFNVSLGPFVFYH